jgi:hypothetical protein
MMSRAHQSLLNSMIVRRMKFRRMAVLGDFIVLDIGV